MWSVKAVLVTAAMVVAALNPGNVASAALPGCQSDIPVEGDVDGDGRSDLVVGLPGRSNGRGEVDLRLTTAPSRILTPAAVGLGASAPGDRFGASVALADLNEDGCDELIVGAPGASGGAGRVYVILGDNDGFQVFGAQPLDGGATPGSGFGSSVAVAHNLGRTGYDLWFGAPSADVGGVSDAGSVVHYSATVSDGVLLLGDVETITQNSPGVPGSAEPNDHFGAVLSATRQGVLVGDPDEDIGSARDAGSVTLLASTDDDPHFDAAYGQSQASPGVAGAPEPGDRFGAAVNAFFALSIVGVPGEDLGSVRDAGMVQTFFSRAFDDPEPIPGAGVSQDSPGVPGVAEVDDRLGSAVVIGRNVDCFENGRQAAIGAPGEDITVNGRTRAAAGTVLVLTVSSFGSCPAHYDDQNTVLDGTPEAGDHLGATLALGRHGDDDDDAADRAFIGVPQEDRGAVPNAGIVQSTAIGSGSGSNSIVVARALRPSVGYSGGASANTNYGMVIASPAGD
jgi:hypothetical protein